MQSPVVYDVSNAKRSMPNVKSGKKEVACIIVAAVGLASALLCHRQARAHSQRHREAVQKLEAQNAMLTRLRADKEVIVAAQSGTESKARTAQKEAEVKLNKLQHELSKSEENYEALSKRLDEHEIELQSSKKEHNKDIRALEACVKAITSERDQAIADLQVIDCISKSQNLYQNAAAARDVCV